MLEDLIPALLSTLEDLRLTRAERIELREVQSHQDRETEPNDQDWDAAEERQYDYEALCSIADAHCPDYCYFGSTDGDGAEIGVWPSLDQLEEDSREVCEPDGVLKMPAGDPFPPTKSCAYVYEVNDHGNATLYRRAGRQWREVWSIV